MIHFIRNYLTPGFIDFIFVLIIFINPSRSKSDLPSGELRADVKIVCIDLSKKFAAFLTTYYRSLILPIIFSKIKLNILIILSSNVFAMQYNDLRAANLTLCYGSFKQSKIVITMGCANFVIPYGQFFSPLIIPGIASNPAVFLFKSIDLIYLSFIYAIILSIWLR